MGLKIEKGIHIVVGVLFNWFVLYVTMVLLASWDINVIIAFIVGFFVANFVANWQIRRYKKMYEGVGE